MTIIPYKRNVEKRSAWHFGRFVLSNAALLPFRLMSKLLLTSSQKFCRNQMIRKGRTFLAKDQVVIIQESICLKMCEPLEKIFCLRMHDHSILKMTVSMTFMLFLWCHDFCHFLYWNECRMLSAEIWYTIIYLLS